MRFVEDHYLLEVFNNFRRRNWISLDRGEPTAKILAKEPTIISNLPLVDGAGMKYDKFWIEG